MAARFTHRLELGFLEEWGVGGRWIPVMKILKLFIWELGGVIFIEIEKKVFMTLPCWERVWSLGEGCCLGRELNSNGVKTWRFETFRQLDTGMGRDRES